MIANDCVQVRGCLFNLCAGDQNQFIAEQVNASLGLNPCFGLKIGHPIGIGRHDNISRGAERDLTRKSGRRGIGYGGVRSLDDLIQRCLQAGRSEHGDRLGADGRQAKRDENPKGNEKGSHHDGQSY